MDTLSTSQFALDIDDASSLLIDVQPYLTDLSRTTASTSGAASTSTAAAGRYTSAYLDTVVFIANKDKDSRGIDVDQHPSTASRQRAQLSARSKPATATRLSSGCSSDIAQSRDKSLVLSHSHRYPSSRNPVANGRPSPCQTGVPPSVRSHDMRDIIRRIRESRQAVEVAKSPGNRTSLSASSSKAFGHVSVDDVAFRGPLSCSQSALPHTNSVDVYKNAEKSRMLCDLADSGETFLLDTTMSGVLAAPSSAKKARSHESFPDQSYLRAKDTLYDDMSFALNKSLPPSGKLPTPHVPMRAGYLHSPNTNQTIVEGSIRLKVGNDKSIMSESFFAPMHEIDPIINAEQSEIMIPRPSWATHLQDRDARSPRSNVLAAASPASRTQRLSRAKVIESRKEFVPLLPKSLSTTKIDTPSPALATTRKAGLPRSPTKADILARVHEADAGGLQSPLRPYAAAQRTPIERRRTVLTGSPAVCSPLSNETPQAQAIYEVARSATTTTPRAAARVMTTGTVRRLEMRSAQVSLLRTNASLCPSASTQNLAERPRISGPTSAIAPPVSASAEIARSRSLNTQSLITAPRQGLKGSPHELFTRMRAHQPASLATVTTTASPLRPTSAQVATAGLEERIAARKQARLALDPNVVAIESTRPIPKSASLASIPVYAREPTMSLMVSTSRLARPSFLPPSASNSQLLSVYRPDARPSMLSRSTSSVSSLSSNTRSTRGVSSARPATGSAIPAAKAPTSRIGDPRSKKLSKYETQTTSGTQPSASISKANFRRSEMKLQDPYVRRR